MLRIGFQNITVIDGDKVEQTNLNRQNFIADDIGTPKVEALYKRLKSINPLANIKVENIFLTKENVLQYVAGYDVAVNAIDFTSDLPFIFDEICAQKKIPVLHPYNLGWASALIVLDPTGDKITSIQDSFKNFELAIVDHVIKYSKKYFDDEPIWLRNILNQYAAETESLPPPQLAVGSFLAAASCTRIACRLVLKEPVSFFPEIYYTNNL